MKDNLSLIAAAAGGFMLSVALAGMLRGAPVVSWQEQSSLRPVSVANTIANSSVNSSDGEFGTFSRKDAEQ